MSGGEYDFALFLPDGRGICMKCSGYQATLHYYCGSTDVLLCRSCLVIVRADLKRAHKRLEAAHPKGRQQ